MIEKFDTHFSSGRSITIRVAGSLPGYLPLAAVRERGNHRRQSARQRVVALQIKAKHRLEALLCTATFTNIYQPTAKDSLVAKSPGSGALFYTAGEETMTANKTANWLIGALVAFIASGTLFYLGPPMPGRAFTKTQTPEQQHQHEKVSGVNHKRTSGDFNW